MLMGPSGPYPGGPPQSATANWGLDNSSMAQGTRMRARMHDYYESVYGDESAVTND